MKKYLVLVLLFASSFAYSQKNDTSDYFSVGVYGVQYCGFLPIYPANNFISGISVELEYRKTKELSFFINGLYQFTGNDIKRMFSWLNFPEVTPINNPENYRTLITIGGRYYLRTENFNPYLQIGLTEEFTYLGEYSYEERLEYVVIHSYNRGFNYSRLEMMAGAGLNVKLYKRLNFDIQYNMYSYLGGINKEYLIHSFNCGLKYNLY